SGRNPLRPERATEGSAEREGEALLPFPLWSQSVATGASDRRERRAGGRSPPYRLRSGRNPLRPERATEGSALGALRSRQVLRVYRIPFSTNVERVALAAGHKGLELEWLDVEEADRSPVEQVSGQPLVPVLIDG